MTDTDPEDVPVQQPPAVGFLIIDEDSIDNGLHYWLQSVSLFEPNNSEFFTDLEVNDDKAAIDLRDVLRFFDDNVGSTITLLTGQVDDEGWFAPQTIPTSWSVSGTEADGLTNYFAGSVPQALLDHVPDVTPLRAAGLEALEGNTYCAVVYDSDIGINYFEDGTLDGNLMGATLGIAAFMVDVDGVNKLDGFSTSTLPSVTITILDANSTCGVLQTESAPIPASSSLPFDIDPVTSDLDEYTGVLSTQP